MATDSQIEAIVDAPGRVLSENIGHGLLLGMSEVADALHRSPEHVRQICRGTAVIDSDEAARFVDAFKTTQPAMVLHAINAFFGPLGYRVCALDADRACLDANKDGRLTRDDALIHRARATELSARIAAMRQCGDGDVNQIGLLGVLLQKEIDAANFIEIELTRNGAKV